MPNVQHYEKINGTPAMPLAITAWKELMNRGLSGNYIPNDIGSTEALVVYDLDIVYLPLGIMTFYNYGKDCLYIDAAYVTVPGKGYYSIMWNRIIEIAKERKMKYICSWILPHNTRMRDIAKKQGRTEDLIISEGREIIESTFLLE